MIDDDLGRSTAHGRALNTRLRRACRGPLLSDLALKVIWSLVMMVVGIAVARWATSDAETMKAAVIGLVMVPFVQSAASSWRTDR